MAGTTLQDVIVPELFNPYVINRTMELSALVQSGIIVNNTEFDALASQASPMVNMPFFEDLTGESEQVIEGTDLNDNKITSNKDVAKTEGPSRTEVAIPKNWKPVYEPKQIRIVAFKHKLG